jgi:hypothetical protein
VQSQSDFGQCFRNGEFDYRRLNPQKLRISWWWGQSSRIVQSSTGITTIFEIMREISVKVRIAWLCSISFRHLSVPKRREIANWHEHKLDLVFKTWDSSLKRVTYSKHFRSRSFRPSAFNPFNFRNFFRRKTVDAESCIISKLFCHAVWFAVFSIPWSVYKHAKHTSDGLAFSDRSANKDHSDRFPHF